MKSLTLFTGDKDSRLLARWEAAHQYLEEGQYGAACAFFQDFVEEGKHLGDSLHYNSMVNYALCFAMMEHRNITAKSVLEHAISLYPEFSLAYYHLSVIHEREGNWFPAYHAAKRGLYNNRIMGYNEKTEMTEPYLMFQVGAAAWWVHKHDEARDMFYRLNLHHYEDLDSRYQQLVDNNMINLGLTVKKKNEVNPFLFNEYNESVKDRYDIGMEFQGRKDIKMNHSQIYQDMFVLFMLNGKKNGTFLELGAGPWAKGNNTFLLEHTFGWEGNSIELDAQFAKEFRKNRKSNMIEFNALAIDYAHMGLPDYIDYLQVDIDPAENSFEALKKLMECGTEFGIITFEHDAYVDPEIRFESREYMSRFDQYTLLVADVSSDGRSPFEDWYVNKNYINEERIMVMRGKIQSLGYYDAIKSEDLFLEPL